MPELVPRNPLEVATAGHVVFLSDPEHQLSTDSILDMQGVLKQHEIVSYAEALLPADVTDALDAAAQEHARVAVERYDKQKHTPTRLFPAYQGSDVHSGRPARLAERESADEGLLHNEHRKERLRSYMGSLIDVAAAVIVVPSGRSLHVPEHVTDYTFAATLNGVPKFMPAAPGRLTPQGLLPLDSSDLKPVIELALSYRHDDVRVEAPNAAAATLQEARRWFGSTRGDTSRAAGEMTATQLMLARATRFGRSLRLWRKDRRDEIKTARTAGDDSAW